jgi:c-di-GMP-binding flagellar brake protein YcgR
MTDLLNQTLASSADLSKYAVRGRNEVTTILGSLRKSGAAVMAYIDHIGNDFILTSIVAVMPEKNLVLLDLGANAEANKRALSATRIVCVTELDGIRIQMSVESLHAVRFEGHEAFGMRIPETLLRLQRRENYRVIAPRGDPPICIIADARALGVPDEMDIVDISCGGVALALPAGAAEIETGTRFNRCRIPLPELGKDTSFGALYGSTQSLGRPEGVEVITNLMVRGTFDIRFANGAVHRRVGCEFIGMRERERALIQRYVSKAERERRYLA